MAVGALLMSMASVQSTVGNPIDTNFNTSNAGTNESRFLKSSDWPANTSVGSELHLDHLRAEGSHEYDVTTQSYNSTTPDFIETNNADSLSIMWYLASFGALVMFFLLISFSEVCCKKSFSVPPEDEDEVSPPPYDLFAPPSYDSLYDDNGKKNRKRKKRRKCEVFVIPVFGDKSSSRVGPLRGPEDGGGVGAAPS